MGLKCLFDAAGIYAGNLSPYPHMRPPLIPVRSRIRLQRILKNRYYNCKIERKAKRDAGWGRAMFEI